MKTNYSELDRQIASEVLDLIKKHSESWSDKTNKYEMGFLIDLISEKLEPYINQSAFAYALSHLKRWTNDVTWICQAIEGKQ